MIKDYFPLLFQVIAGGAEELLKILHRLYLLLKKNGRKGSVAKFFKWS